MFLLSYNQGVRTKLSSSYWSSNPTAFQHKSLDFCQQIWLQKLQHSLNSSKHLCWKEDWIALPLRSSLWSFCCHLGIIHQALSLPSSGTSVISTNLRCGILQPRIRPSSSSDY